MNFNTEHKTLMIFYLLQGYVRFLNPGKAVHEMKEVIQLLGY